MRGLAWGVALGAALGCQEIRAYESPDGGLASPPPVGGVVPAGGSAPVGGGGGGGPHAPVPVSVTGCAPDAVPVTASLVPGGPSPPYWRADLFEISFTVGGGQAAEITVHAPDGGLVEFKSGSFLFSFGPAGPMVTGTKTLTVAATRADGCVGTAALQVRAVGDLVVGDDAGRVILVANDGRVLSNLATVGRGAVTALHFLNGELLVGVVEDAGGQPAVLRLDSAGAIEDRLQMTRGGQAIYTDGAPSALSFDGARYWGAGATGVVYRWDAAGFLIDGGLDVGLRGRTVGFARVGDPDRMVLGAMGDTQLVAVDLSTGAQQTFARLDDEAVALTGTQSGGVAAVYGGKVSLLNSVGGGPPARSVGDPWPGAVARLGDGFILLDGSTGRLHRYDGQFAYVGVIYPAAGGATGATGARVRSLAALE